MLGCVRLMREGAWQIFNLGRACDGNIHYAIKLQPSIGGTNCGVALGRGVEQINGGTNEAAAGCTNAVI